MPVAAGYPKLKAQRQFSVDDGPEIKAKRVYVVPCDDKNDGPDIAAAACPTVGTAFSVTYPSLTVRGVEADEVGRTATGGTVYNVTVEYATKSGGPGGGDPEQSNPNPTARPGVLSMRWQQDQANVYKAIEPPTAEDSDGNPVNITDWPWGKMLCDSAGSPFKDGFSIPANTAVYRFEKNVTMADWTEIADQLDNYAGAVNSDTFAVSYRGAVKVFQPLTVRMLSPTAEPGYENGVAFFRVSVELHVRPEKWWFKVLDQGSFAWQGTRSAGKTPGQVMNEQRDYALGPIPLDGHGKRLADGGKAVFLKFWPEVSGRRLPFAALGFAEFDVP